MVSEIVIEILPGVTKICRQIGTKKIYIEENQTPMVSADRARIFGSDTNQFLMFWPL